MKTIIRSEQAPAPVGPYSQAVKVGDLLFCSGQIAIDPKTNQMMSDADVKTQTKMVMENVGAVLAAAGGHYRDIFKTTIYIMNMSDFGVVNEVYSQYFTQDPPARSTVQVAGLPKNALVEIEVIAKLS